MFVHLNKKISVPNCPLVRAVAWSCNHDYIACGGENGVLKVIKLEETSGSSEPKSPKKEGSKNLSLNQTLDGHKSAVQSICWNESFQKLTSSDATGSIIVWMLYKEVWYEEMVNSRNRSLVSGMAWTADGQKICIAYDDGAIITGSVDGNRIWGKEIKNCTLSKVQWSPDGKIILIGTTEFEIQVFDYLGNPIKKIPLTTNQHGISVKGANPRLMAIKWFARFPQERPLILAFDDGVIHLMRHENDDSPLILHTKMKISSVEWNYFGTMFAITGNMDSSEGSSKNYLKLYSGDGGELIRMIKVPGIDISDCSWEKTGLRLALAVDSYIFFANVKPRYDWGYLTNSIVFVTKNYKDHTTNLVFCDLESNVKNTKVIKNYCLMAAWTFCCAVVAKLDNSPTADTTQSDLHSLTLYNSNGTLIDYHLVNLKAKHCCINSNRMVVTSKDSFYIWNFSQLYNYNNVNNIYADNPLSEFTLGNDEIETIKQQSAVLITADDPISCITASEKYFIVGHESGIINQFLFPNAIHVHKIKINCVPCRMVFNRNSSRLSLIDKTEKFAIYDFDINNEETSTEGDWLDIKFTDVWDMKWANDNNDLIAILEKNKVVFINTATLEKEEPINSNGYLLSFEQLAVKTIRLDTIISDVEHGNESNVSSHIEVAETKLVRDLRQIIDTSLADAVNHCLQFPGYPSLWNIISKASLEQMNLETAALAMSKYKDYKGLQFVNKLKRLKDDAMRKAEILAFFGKYNDAESIYINLDRADLAINLNNVLGDYGRVLALLEKYQVPNQEKEVERAHYNLGMQFADSHDWKQATGHFESIHQSDQLVDCYMSSGDYDGLIKLIGQVNNQETLVEIGMYLESLGLCKDSARAYVKGGKVELALNVCVAMSEWKLAMDLANEHHIEHIDEILNKYVEHLQSENKFVEIIEVYRKANRVSDAISIIMKIINSYKQQNKNDPLTLKKLFVLIGLIYEENRAKGKESKVDTLNELLDAEDVFTANQDTMIEDPWKGAEAYHFYLLAHRHLYQGNSDQAMKAALHLQNYEEFLKTEEIYTLIALASYSNKCFDICSKAFIKLEAISGDDRRSELDAWTRIGDFDGPKIQEAIPEQRRAKYEQLAVDIFLSNPPPNELKQTHQAEQRRQQQQLKIDCKFCGVSIAEYSTACPKCHTKFEPCVASGKSITDPRQQWICKQCTHHAIRNEITPFTNCPLCHSKIE